MSKGSMPPPISLCILLIIVCIVIFGRGRMATKDETNIPAMTIKLTYLEEDELNISEKEVLNMLIRCIYPFLDKKNDKSILHNIYIKYLKDYLSSPGINLTVEKSNAAIDYIIGLMSIMNLEKAHELRNMSLDGKIVAIMLSEKIYQQCGLSLVYNLQGDIIQITDEAGNPLYDYVNSGEQMKIRFNVLAFVLLVIMLLFNVCKIIAKKNQLFMKVGKYDGFTEKEFA